MVQALAPMPDRPLKGPDPAQQHPDPGYGLNSVPFEPRAASPAGLPPSTAVSPQCLASWPEHPQLGPPQDQPKAPLFSVWAEFASDNPPPSAV